jgi:hypothetical protein
MKRRHREVVAVVVVAAAAGAEHLVVDDSGANDRAAVHRAEPDRDAPACRGGGEDAGGRAELRLGPGGLCRVADQFV